MTWIKKRVNCTFKKSNGNYLQSCSVLNLLEGVFATVSLNCSSNKIKVIARCRQQILSVVVHCKLDQLHVHHPVSLNNFATQTETHTFKNTQKGAHCSARYAVQNCLCNFIDLCRSLGCIILPDSTVMTFKLTSESYDHVNINLRSEFRLKVIFLSVK